jgi:lipid II:glycine glycyltransferase (peptidoglycan interpeptide bridge formation enzyme)
MHRVGANPYYLFPPAYFRGLREGLGERLLLVVCLKGDEVASAGLFTLTDGIGQYHLGATADAFAGLAASKQVFDTARVLLAERGARALHLGGGRGAADDSLFRFKAGFSSRRHPFATWRWIVDPGAYARLVAEHSCDPASDFFPAYRAYA